MNDTLINKLFCLAYEAGVTPALRRRRERAERQRSFMREQQENVAILRGSLNGNDENTNGNSFFIVLVLSFII